MSAQFEVTAAVAIDHHGAVDIGDWSRMMTALEVLVDTVHWFSDPVAQQGPDSVLFDHQNPKMCQIRLSNY
jgi:hypothetical protein